MVRGDPMNSAYRPCSLVVKSLAMLALCLVFVSSRPVLAGEDTIIPEAGVSTEAIVKALQDANMNAKLDSDGDAQVRVARQEFWMQGDIDRSRIYFLTFRAFKDGVTQERKMAFVHEINDSLVLVRATLTGKGRLWLDYAFPTEAGITPKQIAALTARFGGVINMIDDADTEGLLE